ncbi:hypothetical protein DIPPA_59816 [Diplonema papillatum]|nr:hypothetical protein DIPPA_59816 [Diplonema papillatum]
MNIRAKNLSAVNIANRRTSPYLGKQEEIQYRITPRDLLACSYRRTNRRRRNDVMSSFARVETVLKTSAETACNNDATSLQDKQICDDLWNQYSFRILEPVFQSLRSLASSPARSTRSLRARDRLQLQHGTDFLPHYLWCSSLHGLVDKDTLSVRAD